MSRNKKLLQCLQELQAPDYSTPEKARTTNAAAERALNHIFQIGREHKKFTDKEEQTIYDLLKTAIRPILAHIERVGCVHRTRLDTATLRKRSAIQFLIDDYGTFPLCRDHLALVFREENIKESQKILDDIISKWRDESDSEVQSDREITGIPSSHTWWF